MSLVRCPGPVDLRDRTGASAVEFALVAPLLVSILVAMFDVGRVILTVTTMEIAVREAARVGRTTAPDGSTDRAALALAAALDKLILRPDPDSVTLGSKVYASFAAVGAAEPYADSDGDGRYDLGEPFTDTNANGLWDADGGRDGQGGSGEIVLYRLSHAFEPILAWHQLLGIDDWTLDLVSSVVVQNETFGEASR